MVERSIFFWVRRELLFLVCDPGLLAAAQGLFPGDEVEDGGALAFGGPGLGFERGELAWQCVDLAAQTLCLDVMRLQDDELGEIRMHGGASQELPPFAADCRRKVRTAEKFESSTGLGLHSPAGGPMGREAEGRHDLLRVLPVSGGEVAKDCNATYSLDNTGYYFDNFLVLSAV